MHDTERTAMQSESQPFASMRTHGWQRRGTPSRYIRVFSEPLHRTATVTRSVGRRWANQQRRSAVFVTGAVNTGQSTKASSRILIGATFCAWARQGGARLECSFAAWADAVFLHIAGLGTEQRCLGILDTCRFAITPHKSACVWKSWNLNRQSLQSVGKLGERRCFGFPIAASLEPACSAVETCRNRAGMRAPITRQLSDATLETMATQAEKAEMFRALHRGPEILVLPNAWDCASARIVEEAGFPAIATSSAGVANALGYSDGEHIPAAEMLAAVARIAR